MPSALQALSAYDTGLPGTRRPGRRLHTMARRCFLGDYESSERSSAAPAHPKRAAILRRYLGSGTAGTDTTARMHGIRLWPSPRTGLTLANAHNSYNRLLNPRLALPAASIVRAMSSSIFHPDLRIAAPFLPRALVNGPRRLRLMRALFGLVARRPASDVEVVPAGTATIRLHRPPAANGPRPALLWIHGGGMISGCAAQDDPLCRYFASELGIVVGSVEYRLAPEHPFPAPLHDCYDALRALAALPEVDADRIVVGGASAGGGLAAALAQLAHDRGEIRPILQLLAYPMLDDRTATRTDIEERGFRLWNNTANRFGWQSYLGRPPGAADIDPLAAPARRTDLSGLPPAWIGVGTLDLFHDEDIAYAGRLAAAGVPQQLEVIEGAFHGFDQALPRVGIAREFRAMQRNALAAAVHGGTPAR